MNKEDEINILSTKKNEIKLRDYYSKVYDSQISNYQHDIEINHITSELNPSKNEVILDIGCGTGRITSKLTKKGSTVVAIDFSGDSIKLCKARCNNPFELSTNVHFIRADACNLPFKDNSFDKCICSEVFEHIPSKGERLKMICEANRVLKDQGIFLLTTFNYNLRKIIGRKRETSKEAALYIYRYDYFSLKRTLNCCFKGKIKIIGMLNLIHFIPLKLLDKHKKLFTPLDKLIEETPSSYIFAHLLSAKCKKSSK
jgi:ubiquinone/menaquinone biosynthesis C-methylase UbiE